MVDGSLTATDADVISRAAVNVIFGTDETLNSNPVGAFSTRVILLPTLKSNLFPSLTVMAPSVVQAGETALPALSAEMLVPPLAGVTEEAPKALPANSKIAEPIAR